MSTAGEMQKQFKDLAVNQIAMSFLKAEIGIDSNSEHEGPGEDWLEDRRTQEDECYLSGSQGH